MKIRLARIVFPLLLLMAGSAGLFAHSDATGIVKERMEAMKAIGKAMKSLGAMAKGETQIREQAIEAAAATIASHAENIGDLFPDTPTSRKSHVTEAAPAIWEDNAGLLSLADRLAKEAEDLQMLSSSEDSGQLGRQLGVLGRTCKACHKKFRIKKH